MPDHLNHGDAATTEVGMPGLAWSKHVVTHSGGRAGSGTTAPIDKTDGALVISAAPADRARRAAVAGAQNGTAVLDAWPARIPQSCPAGQPSSPPIENGVHFR